MRIRFEELEAGQRAGGIETATHQLSERLAGAGIIVSRSSDEDGRRFEADSVHIHGIWSPRLARQSLLAHRRGLPCILSPHGMLQPWALRHKRFKKAIAWRLYQQGLLQKVSVLHASSKSEAEQFKRLRLQARIAVIPWGVPLPALPVADQHTPHGGAKGVRTALFVGRIYPVKGMPLLVEAWSRVRPPGWKMKIVGPDEAGHRSEVEALVQQRGLASDFEFIGELNGEPKRAAYESADLFILPSHTENFGMAIGEALAHGVPVITTQGAPWKLLEEERCGWWTPVSIDGIAAALADATSRSPEELQAMGQRGYDLVRKKFTWEKAAAEMKAVYEWVLGQGNKPDCVVND